MIATRSVERGRSALRKSSQLKLHLHPRPRPRHAFASHSRLLTITCLARLVQTRHAHTSVPFGWTSINHQEDELPIQPQEGAHLARLARKLAAPSPLLGPGPLLPGQATDRSGSPYYYHAAVAHLLTALRQGDTFKLYLSLVSLDRGNKTDHSSRAFIEAVATIPATTFSEILRSFDPYKVAQDIDTAPGLNISYGVAIHTPLGELVNKWGVKTLYVRIFNRLLNIQLARREAGFVPLMNDYVALIRCAGATSNIRAAKDVWSSMSGDKRANMRSSEAYSEFIKARYLAEKMYANNDLSRFRLRPIDMHRSAMWLPSRPRTRLRSLIRRITDRRTHRFGDNIHEPFFAEPLTKVLRKRVPLLKLERTLALRGFDNGDEDLSCARLKVNARAGRLEANNRLLRKNWCVDIKMASRKGVTTVEGGHTYPPGSPRAPTAALLDAIVHSYCSMGEITLAVRLLDHMSQHFGIPVPDHVWSDLIEYIRVMESRPVKTEWAIAGFPHKGSKPGQLLEVWSLCTQAPYSFRPGAKDYYNLIRSLVIGRQEMSRPIEALRQIRPLYDDAVDACEQAWCELMQTTRQAVPNHSAFRRYKALEARRIHMWYMFHYSTYLILKGTRPGRVDSRTGTREIPNLVGDFSQFVPSKVRYSIATGVVEFTTDNRREKTTEEIRKVTRMDEVRPTATRESGESDEDEAAGLDELVLEADPDLKHLMHMTPQRRVVGMRDAEKPAHLYRPPYSGPSDKPSLVSIRRDGGEFMGYHNNPWRKSYAAYSVNITTRRVAGVPVYLGQGRLRMMGQVLNMRT